MNLADVTFLPLASGEYVLVPQAHADELGKNLDKLDMTGGYLVIRPPHPASRRNTGGQRRPRCYLCHAKGSGDGRSIHIRAGQPTCGGSR